MNEPTQQIRVKTLHSKTIKNAVHSIRVQFLKKKVGNDITIVLACDVHKISTGELVYHYEGADRAIIDAMAQLYPYMDTIRIQLLFDFCLKVTIHRLPNESLNKF